MSVIYISSPVDVIKVGGQEIEKSEFFYIWNLGKGIYKTAGEKYWKGEVQGGGEPKPGISLNKKLLARAIDDARRLLVHDLQEGTYRLLKKEGKAWQWGGRTNRDGAELIVVPISCFETVEVIRED